MGPLYTPGSCAGSSQLLSNTGIVMAVRDEINVPSLPKLKHRDQLYRDGWLSFMLCGKSGCGKTSLMAKLVPGISEKVKFIVIATQNEGNPFHLAIQKWSKEHKRVCVISSDADAIREFMSGLHRKGWLVPGTQEALLIFDDFAIDKRSTRKSENLVVEAFTRWRNMGVNFVIVCQDASMVATSCRNCTNMRALFASASNTALRTFNKDIIDRVADQEVYKDMVRYICTIPYSYILIRESPLEVAIGKGTTVKRIMGDHDVTVPTYRELMRELGAKNPGEMTHMADGLQRGIGNTAPELGSNSRRGASDDSEDESEDDSRAPERGWHRV
jgi:GTPase SAR1 family protein